ncbi:glutaredoxin family protein [Marinobacterium litorale]|uniref:glutaredoxin family protein n=1 Tax=Marinobacterium litorale TaxID=404770 RepID=UPI0004137AE5|nr:glutaredoxin [Marinobacterium litorale]
MIKVLGHKDCSFCKQAILLLATSGKSFSYVDAREPENAALIQELRDEGISTVPQIWIGNERIGGFNELKLKLSQ